MKAIETMQAAAGSGDDDVCRGLRTAEAPTCRDGYRLGERDASQGLSRNYQRYEDHYDSDSEQFFRQGYRAGWNETTKSQ